MDITPEIIASFRAANTAFSNVTTYPDAMVSGALCEADAETGGKGWGGYQDECHNFKRRGMFLYACHYLAVLYPNGAAGAISGGTKGIVASKAVGDESVSMYTGSYAGLRAGDEWLAASVFGQQWLRLRRRAGMGARAV